MPRVPWMAPVSYPVGTSASVYPQSTAMVKTPRMQRSHKIRFPAGQGAMDTVFAKAVQAEEAEQYEQQFSTAPLLATPSPEKPASRKAS